VAEQSATSAVTAERWVDDLREQLVDDGHDRGRVDELIASTLARFDSARIRVFIPVLVARSVREELGGSEP
jgi:type IV pilus biogenesis protein CpaD/CtpE